MFVCCQQIILLKNMMEIWDQTPDHILDCLQNGRSLILYSLKDTKENQQNFIKNCLNIALEDPFMVLPTSGSSGKPKGVVISHQALLHSAEQVCKVLKINGSSRLILSLPAYHAGGLAILVRGFLAKCEFVKTNPTHISLVPTQALKLFSDPDFSKIIKTCKIIIGGALVPKVLIEMGQKLGIKLYISYGSSEAGSTIALNGKILPHINVKIIAEEICLKSPYLFSGYINNNRFIPQNGLFKTGDIGYFEGENKLVVLGRKDYRITSGGEKVYPEEIEQAFFYLKGTLAVCVVATPHNIYGQRPVAFLQSEYCFDEDNIKESLLSYLPKWKIPDKIYPWPDFAEGLKPDRHYFRTLGFGVIF